MLGGSQASAAPAEASAATAAAGGSSRAVSEYAEHASLLAASLAHLQQQLALADDTSSSPEQQQQQQQQQYKPCFAGGVLEALLPTEPYTQPTTQQQPVALETYAAQAPAAAAAALLSPALSDDCVLHAQLQQDSDVIATEDAAEGMAAADAATGTEHLVYLPTIGVAALDVDAAGVAKDTAATTAAAAVAEQHQRAFEGLIEQQQQQQQLQLHDSTSAVASTAMMPFRLWAAEAGSSNVAILLRQPAALLQLMQQQSFTARTAAGYIACVQLVLTLPAVAALLTAAELASLLQQLSAAKQELDGAYPADMDANHAAAAAAAAVTVAASSTALKTSKAGTSQQHESVVSAYILQQQQQQQRQAQGTCPLSLQQLQQELLAACEPSRAADAVYLFNLWSTACGSSDVATMLRQPAALLQHLALNFTASTVALCLRRLCQVLQVPAVAGLLPAAELAGVLQQIEEAEQQQDLAVHLLGASAQSTPAPLVLMTPAAAAAAIANSTQTHQSLVSAAAAAAAAAPQWLPSAEQQQEQVSAVHVQHHSHPAASTMDLQQLQQLVRAACRKNTEKTMLAKMRPFHAWSEACGSSDVRTLLQQPAVLLQLLQQRQYTAHAAVYALQHVDQVLRVPAVAALLSQAELSGLRWQLMAARRACNNIAAAATASAAVTTVGGAEAAAAGAHHDAVLGGGDLLGCRGAAEAAEAAPSRPKRRRFTTARSATSSAAAGGDAGHPTPFSMHKVGSDLQQQQRQQQQDEEQQQQEAPAPPTNLEQLKQVLQTCRPSQASALMLPFNTWGAACGSSDVRTLLQQPAALLQLLQQKYAAGTAADYLRQVLAVLQVPAVAALLPPAELASLQQQLTAAKQQHDRARNVKAKYTVPPGAQSAAEVAPAAAAAAAAMTDQTRVQSLVNTAAAAAQCHLRAEQQQQQEEEEEEQQLGRRKRRRTTAVGSAVAAGAALLGGQGLEGWWGSSRGSSGGATTTQEATTYYS
jgi:hypothetical protein